MKITTQQTKFFDFIKENLSLILEDDYNGRIVAYLMLRNPITKEQEIISSDSIRRAQP